MSRQRPFIKPVLSRGDGAPVRPPRIFELAARAPERINYPKGVPAAAREELATSINTGRTIIVVFDGLDRSTMGHRPTEFPGLPPFDDVWLEWESSDPELLRAERSGAMALHVFSKRNPSGNTVAAMTMFVRHTGGGFCYLGQAFVEWDDRGVLHPGSAAAIRDDVAETKATQSMPYIMVVDACYAFCMMGCGNVSVVHGGFSDDGLTNRQRRERGRGHIAYKVLKVQVGKDREYVLGRGTAGEALDLPLHAVRGHFKTYTAERPLFGQYVGRYWWPSHARGKAENGEIRKSYEVEARSNT